LFANKTILFITDRQDAVSDDESVGSRSNMPPSELRRLKALREQAETKINALR